MRLSTALFCIALATATVSAQKKYPLTSAVIEMSLTMSGPMTSSGTIVQSFDQSGARECLRNKTAMTMMGMSVEAETRSLSVNGKFYIIDVANGTCSVSDARFIDDPLKLDFEALTADAKKRWNFKKEGTGEVCGKQCDIYSLATDDIEAGIPESDRNSPVKVSLKGRCWVWKNIGLKSEFTLNDVISMTCTATKISENVKIDESEFMTPAGCTE